MSGYVTSNERAFIEKWVGKDADGRGGSLIWGTGPVFAWRNEGELRTELRQTGLWAEVLTWGYRMQSMNYNYTTSFNSQD